MKQTIFAVSRGTRGVEDAIAMLIDIGIALQDMSIILPESTDIPQNYFQRLDLIDTIAGERIGVNPIAVVGVEDVLLFGGPVSDRAGVSKAVETEDPEESVTGPLAGGLLNTFMDIGLSEEIAKKYTESLNEGDIIFGVSVDDDKKMAVADILTSCNLTDSSTISF